MILFFVHMLLVTAAKQSLVVFVAEGCPQIATCGVMRQGCTSAQKQIRNLPLHSGHGSVQPRSRTVKAANVVNTVLDVVLFHFATLRCLNGP